MIQSYANKVIITVAHKYISNISELKKRAAIENNSSVHLEDFVNIVGIIHSIPKTVTQDRTHYGFSTKDIRVGDTAIFSFSVIYDFYIKEGVEEPFHKNMITFEGKEYWQADITKIYGVIRNGEIIMINGYVMATTFPEDKIFLQPTSKKTKGVKSSIVMHIGKPKEHLPQISIKPGDTIYFNPMIAQKYQINDKPFIILQQHQVLGRLSSMVKKQNVK